MRYLSGELFHQNQFSVKFIGPSLFFPWLLVPYFLTDVFILVLFTSSTSHPHPLCWSSHSQMFFKKSVLKNFANFTGKHLLVLKSSFNKVPGFQAYNFIKKILQSRCFLVKFAKFLRTPIWRNICKRLFQHRRCGCDADDVKRTKTNTLDK